MFHKQLTLRDDININNVRRGNIVTKKQTKDEDILEYKSIIKNQEIHIDFVDDDDENGIIIPP